MEEKRTKSDSYDYVRTAARHRGLIAGFALLGAVLSLLFGLRQEPLYRARTTVEMDASNNSAPVSPQAPSGAVSTQAADLQSRIHLLQSPALLQATSNHIFAEPHPVFVPKADLLSRVLRVAHISQTEPIPYANMVQDAARRVRVKAVSPSSLVEITCDSRSPELSASFCNTLADTYEDQDLQARNAESAKTNEWLTRRVEEVHQRIAETQKRLRSVAGRSSHAASQNAPAGEQSLHALQQQLQQAEADRIAQESKGRGAPTAPARLQRTAQTGLLRRELDSEQQLYATLLQRAREAAFRSAMPPPSIRVLAEAVPPAHSFSPHRVIAGAVGLVIGCLAGFGVAFLRDRRFKVFRLPGDAGQYLHVHELGVVPAIKRHTRRLLPAQSLLHPGPTETAEGEAVGPTRWDDPVSVAADAYRTLSSSILHADSGKRVRTYVICSPNQGDGKTTVISNLGVAFSKDPRKVVLVDGDLRHPRVHDEFRVSNDFGLRNLLRGEKDLATSPLHELTQTTSFPNLWVVPAGTGTESTTELLGKAELRKLLKRLAEGYQVILIDSPSVLHSTDAPLLAAECDGAVLIIRSGVTTLDEAADARDLLDYEHVSLLGTILNDFDASREGQSARLGAEYTYEDHDKTPEKVVSVI